jgi:hypothetical protein
MELLCDVAHVEFHFGPFHDVVSVRARLVHGLCQMYHRVRNHFGHTRWYSKLTGLKWKLVSIYLEIVLILTHCAEHTMGSKIISDALDGTPSGSSFWSVWR